MEFRRQTIPTKTLSVLGPCYVLGVASALHISSFSCTGSVELLYKIKRVLYSYSHVRMVGFDISSHRPPCRELWSKKMDITFHQVFQTDTKLLAVAHTRNGFELVEVDPRTGNSWKIYSLEGYNVTFKGFFYLHFFLIALGR